MPAFLSGEWFTAVAQAGAELGTVEGLTFSFDIEVAESAMGKARGHGAVEDGRLVLFAPGKADGPVDVSLSGKNSRALPVIVGDRNALVAYMLGEIKIEGAYELVVDHFANRTDPAKLTQFAQAVSAATDV